MIKKEKGLALIFVLIVLVALSGVTFGFWYMTKSGLNMAGAELSVAQAFYLAEAGHDRARYMINNGSTVPYTETNTALGAGTYTVTAVYSDPPTNSQVTITSDGYVPNSTKPIARRQFVEKNIVLGGTNLSLYSSGTRAYATSWQGGNIPDEAIDGRTITGWVSGDKGYSELWLDYGSAKTVSRVVVSGSKISSIVVQYSNNGTSWTAVSNPSGALPGTRTFTAVTARYLKLAITSGANEKAQVNEFESYASGSGAGLGKGAITTSY
jgi:hypothetical protein